MRVEWAFTNNRLEFQLFPESDQEKMFLPILESYDKLTVHVARPETYSQRFEAESVLLGIHKTKKAVPEEYTQARFPGDDVPF